MLGSGQKIAFLGYRWGIVGVSLNPVGNSVNSSIYNIMFFLNNVCIYIYHIRRDGSKPCYSDSHNMV